MLKRKKMQKICLTLLFMLLTITHIGCGSGAKESDNHTPTPTASKLSQQLRVTLVTTGKSTIQQKLDQDGMTLLDFSLSLKGGGILAIGANNTKTQYNIYRFNANPLQYEETYSRVNIPAKSTITSIQPLKGGKFKITTFNSQENTTMIYNYLNGTQESENNILSAEDTVRAFVEAEGLNLLAWSYSLHGGGIIAIGATNAGESYKVYRFDASTLAHEQTFNNVGIHAASTISSITPLEGGTFEIVSFEGGQSETAIMNYFNGEFSYNTNTNTIQERIRERLAQDGMHLLNYQYSLQRGGILAIGWAEQGAQYNFYRFNASPLALEETFENVAVYYGDVITDIIAKENQNFEIHTTFYGLSNIAHFNYATGAFSY
jgi:hypothetical protein